MDNTISRAELARRLGVSRTYVTLLIQGKRNPGQQLANRIKQLALTVSAPDMDILMHIVGKAGLESARPKAHDPKSCPSASSGTSHDNKSSATSLTPELLEEFLEARRPGLSPHTMAFYRVFLSKAIGIELTPRSLTKFINSLPCGNGKHGYYRALRVLCFWMYKQDYLDENPIVKVDSPKLAKRILPVVTANQVEVLLNKADYLRDQCIISLLFESGLRLSEVCRSRKADIDWPTRTLRVVVKGNREEKAMFGERTEWLLRVYLNRNGHGDKLFDLEPRGVQHMLEILGEKTGIRCNAHSFRRGFACELHKRGVSTLSIMHLGRWSSIEMVVKYTQSLTFEDCVNGVR